MTACFFAAALLAWPGPADKPLAPRISGLGSLHFEITADAEGAQDFFDQGLKLLYAFNHAEALRAFDEAARQSPACAMAYWGRALALGPNLNQPMSPENAQRAHEAITRALAARDHASEREQALIEALAHRFSAEPDDRQPQRDLDYAAAMKRVADRFPDDDDVLTLYAAALMETRPWNYWGKRGEPLEGVPEALATLETVLKRSPRHAGAIHYYIHLVEASDAPERAEAHADRLGPLMPAAGHMVHMPSHIYVRVGRYADASDVNELAIKADEGYLAQCHAQGLYPREYYPHNVHFLWCAATMEGRSQVALEAARKVTGKSCCTGSMLALEDIAATTYYALVRFGRWDEIARLPRPEESAPYRTAMWHYARGVAFAAQGRTGEAQSELEAIRAAAADPELAEMKINFSTARETLAIAAGIVEAEIHARSRRYPEAIRALRQAVAIQDGLTYTEPPTWHYPVRQSLGAILIEAGQPADAEAVYREDLARWPENGWSLFGLLQALRAQGRDEAARRIEERFQKAWSRADVVLTQSVFR